MSKDFDFDAALAALQGGQDLTGRDGILTPLIKQLTEAALNAEMDAHLDSEDAQNSQSNRRKVTALKLLKRLLAVLHWRHHVIALALLNPG